MTKHFNSLTSNFRIPTLLCDFYKVSHKAQYPQGTQFIYSTLTPRSIYLMLMKLSHLDFKHSLKNI